jgi:hypothetical protein
MGPAPSAAEWQQSAFVQELWQLGYVEGQTIGIEQRYANGGSVSKVEMTMFTLPVQRHSG